MMKDKVRSNSTREDRFTPLSFFFFRVRSSSFAFSQACVCVCECVRINILLSSSLVICYITSNTISANKRQFELDKTGYTRPDKRQFKK